MDRVFIKKFGIALSIMPSNNVFTVLMTNKYGETIGQRTFFSLADAKECLQSVCKQIKASHN